MINLTPEQFKKKYGESGVESFKPENVRKSILTSIREGIGEAQKKPTYLSRVATRIGDAANTRADEFSAIDQLGSTGTEKFVQKTGTALALPFKDVIGAGLSELPGAKQVGQSFAAEIKKASDGNLSQWLGNKIGENASVQEIVDLYDNDPNFRQTVNSTFNVVNAIVTAKGIGDTANSVKGMLTTKKVAPPVKQAAVGSDEIGVKEYNVAKPKPIANPEIDTVVNNHVKSAKMILQDATENGDNIPLNTLIADTKKEILAGLQKTDNAAYKVAAKQISKLDTAQFSSVDDFSNAVKNVVNNPAPNSITFGDNVYSSPRTAAEKVPFAGRVMPADPNAASKATGVAKLPTSSAGRLAQFIAEAPDPKVATVLKETPKPIFDRYVKLAEEAAVDTKKVTPFEAVGDRMAEATKKLQKSLTEIGKKKGDFLQPLKFGLDPFDAGEFVDDLIKLKNKLPDESKSYVQSIIAKAKAIKTKGGADKFIDEIQDKIYSDKAQGIVTSGSAIDKQLKGVLGKLNGKLKNSLPAEYSELNAQYARVASMVKIMSKALGEAIDGSPIRGGALVKQFFSPSGRKAKLLFEFIKKETGIDLAQESTLAKYAMEMFNDPRGRSLLEGIPLSPTGLATRLTDILVEKTGVGSKIQGKLKEAALKKARDLTQ